MIAKNNTCRRCLWQLDCHEDEEICEYFDPIDDEHILLEYEKDLIERVDTYNEIIEEFE